MESRFPRLIRLQGFVLARLNTSEWRGYGKKCHASSRESSQYRAARVILMLATTENSKNALSLRGLKNNPRILRFEIGILVLGILPFISCSRLKTESSGDHPSKALVWPSPPDPPRIALLQVIGGPADFGIKASPLTRFGHWLTGSAKGNEQLVKPFGIALDESDNLCLTDTGANAVCFYERAKKKWQRWERIERVRFVSPVAVAKRNGTFFVADSGLASIVVFAENGKLVRQITNHLERPSGLAILNDRLFVADSQRHHIVVFDLQGNYQAEFGNRGVGPGQFNFPTHLAAGLDGSLFVTDSMNSRIQMVDERGTYKGQVGQVGDSPGHFSRPKGVAVDSFGHVYVMDALFDNLQIFDRSGRLLLNFGETGAQAGQFWLPNGIAITRSNEIFVADSHNHRVQIFKYVGVTSE
jgi:sugar lactone lactonase YvrE